MFFKLSIASTVSSVVGGAGSAIVSGINTLSSAISSTAAISAGGAIAINANAVALAGVLGIGVLFASNERPGNNKVQNKQFKEIMKKLGYKKTDWQWRYGHDHLPKQSLGFKKLYEFLSNLFGK